MTERMNNINYDPELFARARNGIDELERREQAKAEQARLEADVELARRLILGHADNQEQQKMPEPQFESKEGSIPDQVLVDSSLYVMVDVPEDKRERFLQEEANANATPRAEQSPVESSDNSHSFSAKEASELREKLAQEDQLSKTVTEGDQELVVLPRADKLEREVAGRINPKPRDKLSFLRNKTGALTLGGVGVVAATAVALPLAFNAQPESDTVAADISTNTIQEPILDASSIFTDCVDGELGDLASRDIIGVTSEIAWNVPGQNSVLGHTVLIKEKDSETGEDKVVGTRHPMVIANEAALLVGICDTEQSSVTIEGVDVEVNLANLSSSITIEKNNDRKPTYEVIEKPIIDYLVEEGALSQVEADAFHADITSSADEVVDDTLSRAAKTILNTPESAEVVVNNVEESVLTQVREYLGDKTPGVKYEIKVINELPVPKIQDLPLEASEEFSVENLTIAGAITIPAEK